MLNFIRPRSLLLLVYLLGIAPRLFAQSVLITVAPPPLPVYEQPDCPDDGYLWIPGYWAHGEYGYFWVPGVWVEAPEPEYLWTPGYWGYGGGAYRWHGGYWGPHIGFYGGVNYGFGYYGSGFYGGRWEGGAFHYNTAVWRVNSSSVHNTYADRTVINNQTVINNNHVSFNGPGGIEVKPTAAESAAAQDRHLNTTDQQRAHEEAARHDQNQRFSVNHGHPANAAQIKAGEPQQTEHHATENHQTGPQTEHQATEHHQGEPQQAEHHATEHHQGEPQQAEHHATEHHQGEPQQAEHHATEHHQAQPHQAEHHAPEHHQAQPHQAEHHAAKPQPQKHPSGGEKKEKKG
jgi:hypothetical protein